MTVPRLTWARRRPGYYVSFAPAPQPTFEISRVELWDGAIRWEIAHVGGDTILDDRPTLAGAKVRAAELAQEQRA